MDCWRVSALAASLLIASVSPTLANLVADPGFELCTSRSMLPPDWTLSESAAVCDDSNPHSGSWDAIFDAPPLTTLTQSISTTAGDMYEFSFWLYNHSDIPNGFTASFGADEVLDLTNAGPFTYTFEDFTVTAGAGSSTTIGFTANPNDAWYLDDVSVTAVAAVPEPPSLALVATGLLALGLAALYRRRPARS